MGVSETALRIALAGLILTDGDDIDVLGAFQGGTTILEAGEYAVVVDPEYDGVYAIGSSVTTVSTPSGNSTSTSLRLCWDAP